MLTDASSRSVRAPVIVDGAAAAEHTAALVISLLRARPDAVLGLATGATMEPVYARLTAACRAGQVSFARASSFNLDEYVGLSPDHPASYRATMNRLLFDHVDIDRSRTFVPDGMARSPVVAARAYEQQIIRAGGIDLQLLGIGRNGHIGFNEPGSLPDSQTRVVRLHASTQQANRSFFGDGQVPLRAVTMGIGTILRARSIVVLATGAAKAGAVARALLGPQDRECPGSFLARHHDVGWVLDHDAATGLGRTVARMPA
jgi:glucosamine-6-phosphate deaminase